MNGTGPIFKCCAIFSHNHTGKSAHRELRFYVTKTFDKWKNVIEFNKSRNNADCHKNNAYFPESFLTTFSKRQLYIIQNLDSVRTIVENRKRLKSIIQTLLLCGRQELAFRRKSDCGFLTLKEPIHNDGNFRAILRM